ncbi:MAG TPA: hypothetical protein VK530_21030 [Candidatus Acidoferrum sp.]|nr:hypothetical protein [Candidatus Acidoferrum sp.]
MIVAEHGTAAVRGSTRKDKADKAVMIREGLDQKLYDMSGGLITVDRSGFEGATAHAGQYPGLPRGNFRMKASLESSNNLTHNVFAALPGQTGKDVTHRPEELDAMLNNNRDLLLASRYLSAERAAMLDYPILSDLEFHTIAHELYGNIDADCDHELDQWEECGHVVNELEIAPGRWVPREELLRSPEAAALARTMIESGQMKTRPRKMSRGEVWRAGAGELVKITGEGVCAILGDDLALARRVTKNRFEFCDLEVGSGIHRFDSLAFNSYGESLQLRDGETYETFVNPFAPDTLFVRRANGAYIGECRRIHTVCRGDAEAVQRAQGEAAKREKELLIPVRDRHLAEGREKTRRHNHNADVLAGRPVTFAERGRALALRKMDGSSVGELAEPNEVSAADGFEEPSEAEFSAEGLL